MNFDKEQAITIEVGSNEPVVHISLEDFDYICSVFERLLDRLELEDFAHADLNYEITRASAVTYPPVNY